MTIAFGLLIELWKIPKCLNVEVSSFKKQANKLTFHIQIIRDQPLFGVIPRIRFSDKGSYVESATKNYDHVC